MKKYQEQGVQTLDAIAIEPHFSNLPFASISLCQFNEPVHHLSALPTLELPLVNLKTGRLARYLLRITDTTYNPAVYSEEAAIGVISSWIEKLLAKTNEIAKKSDDAVYDLPAHQESFFHMSWLPSEQNKTAAQRRLQFQARVILRSLEDAQMASVATLNTHTCVQPGRASTTFNGTLGWNTRFKIVPLNTDDSLDLLDSSQDESGEISKFSGTLMLGSTAHAFEVTHRVFTEDFTRLISRDAIGLALEALLKTQVTQLGRIEWPLTMNFIEPNAG